MNTLNFDLIHQKFQNTPYIMQFKTIKKIHGNDAVFYAFYIGKSKMFGIYITPSHVEYNFSLRGTEKAKQKTIDFDFNFHIPNDEKEFMEFLNK